MQNTGVLVSGSSPVIQVPVAKATTKSKVIKSLIFSQKILILIFTVEEPKF